MKKTIRWNSSLITLCILMLFAFMPASIVHATTTSTSMNIEAMKLNFDVKYTGHIETDDNVVYKMELPKAGKIDISCFNTYYEGRLCVYDENFESVDYVTEYSNSIGVCSLQLSKYLLKGTYYIEIESDNSWEDEGTDYELKVKYEKSNVSFEESLNDNNNDYFNADIIEFNKNYIGQMCEQNVKDVYKITFSETKKMNFKFSTKQAEWGKDVWVEIYNSDYECIKSFDMSYSDSVLNEYLQLGKGTYYFLIESEDLEDVYNFKLASHTHTYGEWISQNKATCTNDGKRKRVCSVCMHADIQTTAKLGHKYSAKWTIDKRATMTTNGSKSHHCIRCNAQNDKTIIYKAKTVKLSTVKYEYNGKMKSPSVIIKSSKGKVISSKNYTITKAKGRKNVGKYTYKITFKNQYKGTKSLTFTINPKATKLKTPIAAKKAFTVKWGKVSKQATGYEIMYATDKNFTKNKKTIKIKNYKITSKKIKNLKAKKTYYVKVRTYKTIDGKKFYSKWSEVKKIKTK